MSNNWNCTSFLVSFIRYAAKTFLACAEYCWTLDSSENKTAFYCCTVRFLCFRSKVICSFFILGISRGFFAGLYDNKTNSSVKIVLILTTVSFWARVCLIFSQKTGWRSYDHPSDSMINTYTHTFTPRTLISSHPKVFLGWQLLFQCVFLSEMLILLTSWWTVVLLTCGLLLISRSDM